MLSVGASLLLSLFAALLQPVTAQRAPLDVLTYRYDSARSGANLEETELTPSAVKTRGLRKLVFRNVDGNVYAQPLIVTEARDPNGGTRNLAIVATEHNSVYAFDTEDLAPDAQPMEESQKQIWKRTLGDAINSSDLAMKIGATFCRDLTTEIGITGTPAIKLTKQTAPKEGVIFVASKSSSGQDAVYHLFALNLADGSTLGNPVRITGNVTTADGSSIEFKPLLQLNRPALLLDSDVLYIAFGGHCDTGDYRGWMFAYDVSNPASPTQLGKLTTTFTPRSNHPDDKEGRGGIGCRAMALLQSMVEYSSRRATEHTMSPTHSFPTCPIVSSR